MRRFRGKGIVLGGAVALAAVCLVWAAIHYMPSPVSPPSTALNVAGGTPDVQPAKALPSPPEIDFTDVDHAVVKAIELAQAKVAEQPQSAATWGGLGMVLLAHEFNDDAVECFTEAERLQPTEPRWPYFHAVALMRLQPEAAIPPLTRAVELCHGEPLAPQLRLFELYFETNRAGEIEDALRAFLATHPENGRAHLLMARLALRQDKLDACLNELMAAQRDRSAQKLSHELRAEVYHRQGHKPEAAGERAEALRSPSVAWPDPFSAEVGRLRTGLKVELTKADRLFTRGDIEGSVAVVQKTLQQYPESEWAWLLLARSQIRQRRLDDAQKSLGKALAISPHSADAHFRMGVTCFLQGRYAQAARWFTDVLEQKPDHSIALYNLGMCHQQLQHPDEALRNFRKALECQPDYFDAQVALGAVLAHRGETHAAREAFARALELRPDDSYAASQMRRLQASDSP